jgi:hypothetical protein
MPCSIVYAAIIDHRINTDIMNRTTKSLLQELESFAENSKDVTYIVESRGSNVITSAINLLETIAKYYSKEEAELLERRLLSAIKNRDQNKFSRSVRKKGEVK